MTLGEAKKRLLILLDESKPKADLTGKFNLFLDMGQKEVALYYPIYRVKEYAADSMVLDLPEEAAPAVIFYAAAQCNSMEYDQRFFQSFYAQYQGKLSNLSGQADGPAAVVTGGCNV